VAVGAGAAVIALVTWAFIFSRISYLPSFAIEKISVYGADPDITPVLSLAAGRAMDGAYLGMFSRSNALIYPRSGVETAVAAASPRVSHVQVRLDGANAIAVTVSEKVPAAIVCADLPDFDVLPSGGRPIILPDDHCYYTDEGGTLFEHAPASASSTAQSPLRYFIPALPDTGDLSGMNAFATDTARFARIESFVGGLSGLDSAPIEVLGVLAEDGGRYELYAENPDGASIVVIHADEASGLDTELRDLVAFWSRTTADARAAKDSLEWSEIKLQYPPNVYYTLARPESKAR